MQQSKTQTLITGVYRSGSEYITHLINCHPAVCASMYRVNLLRFIYRRYDPISEPANQARAIDDLNKRMTERYGMSVSKQEVLEHLAAHQPVTYGNLYDAIMTVLYLREGCEHWAEKVQLHWREIPDFLKFSRNGRAILILRDPRSVLASFKHYTHAPKPAYLGAIFNCYDALWHARKFEQEYSGSEFMVLRYEDAATNPQFQAERIWAFIGLEGAVAVDQAGWKDAYGRAWHSNSSFVENHAGAGFDIEASVRRWRSVLSSAEVELTEGVCGELMQGYGYDSSCSSVDWLSALKLILGDESLTRYFREWLLNGSGIQAFPQDPLDPKTWEQAG